jgi:hypothetical protein
MCKYIIIFLCIFSLAFSGNKEETDGNNDYCSGWKKGYEFGYCYKDQNCIVPVIPVCPIADPNFNTYEYGRKDGFIKGQKDRK